MTICNSCFYARVKRRKGRQSMLCAYEQGAKIHREYCPDYMNRESVIKWDKNKRKERERYKELGGYLSTSI